ncbi:MAG: M24 family metallopeptidase [Actinobacteria bacterium]|nr:M24 family metallopeptidase [Actinomycetota bacterium]
MPGAAVIRAHDASSALGHRLLADVPEGAPIVPYAIAEPSVLGVDEALIPVALEPGYVPAGLAAGDLVRAVISFPNGGTDAPLPEVLPATVEVVDVGTISEEDRHLIAVTEECMWLGIETVKPDVPLSEIGRAIESHARKHRMGVVRSFIGHGIGEQFHTDIQVLHYYEPRNNTLMRPGMTFTIEPMITLGSEKHRMWDDEWTAVTVDGKRTAQFEHTVLVTDSGYDVLTAPGAVSPTFPRHD